MVSSQAPGSRAAGQRPSNTPDNLASSNSTLNAFLGGRQKSWMTGGLVPVVSNTFSNYQRPPAPQISVQNRQAALHNSSSHAATQNATTRAGPAPRALPHSNSNSPLTANFIPQVSTPSFSSTAQDPVLPSPAPSDETRMQAMSPVLTNNPPTWPSVSEMNATSSNRNDRVLPDQVDTNQQRKRQRMDTTGSVNAGASLPSSQIPSNGNTGLQTATMANAQGRGLDPMEHRALFKAHSTDPLHHFIATLGGWQNIGPSLEAPRLRLLRDACTNEDYFYLTLHQAFCLSTSAPQKLDMLPQFGQDDIRGFAIVTDLLLSNQGLPKRTLDFLSQYPAPLDKLLEGSGAFQTAYAEVRTCLVLLGRNWQAILERCYARWYPPLVEDLATELGIRSPIFQRVAFTGLYRRVWHATQASSNNLARRLDELFTKDQNDYRRREQLAANGQLPASAHNISAANKQLRADYQRVLLEFHEEQVHAQVSSAPILPSNASQAVAPPPFATTFSQPINNVGVSPFLSGSSSTAAPQQFFPQSSMPPNLVEPERFAAQLWNQAGQRAWPQSPMNQQPPMARTPSTAQPSPVNRQPVTLYQPAMVQQQSPMSQEPPINQQSPMSQQPPINQQSLMSQQPPINQQSPLIRQNPLNQQSPLNQQPPMAQTAPQTAPRRRGRPPRYDPSGTKRNTQTPGPIQTAFQLQHMPSPHAPTSTFNHQVTPMGIPLLPLPGFVNPSHANPNPSVAALHQSHLRSPPFHKRNLQGHTDTNMKLYQYPTGFAFPIYYLGPSMPSYSLKWHTAIADFQRKVIDVASARNSTSTRVILDGAMLFRLRCVKLPNPILALDESTWTVTENAWPSTFYVKINGNHLELRRKFHYGKDLPLDLTQHIRAGANELEISFLRNESERTTAFYAVAVEHVQVASHDHAKRKIGSLSMKDSLSSITGSLNRSDGDDDIQVVDDYISIDLMDPFTARIFDTPVRGKKCLHRECFDLETFLETRKSKRRDGPTLPDEWRCPICGLDARPQSLIVDEFLHHVRTVLEDTEKLEAKAILVKRDGSWETKALPQDSSNEARKSEGVVGASALEHVRDLGGGLGRPVIDLDGDD